MIGSPEHHGELLRVPERVILAPVPGRFRPVDAPAPRAIAASATTASATTASATTASATAASATAASAVEVATLASGDGTNLAREQVIGFVDGIGSSTPVCSPFPGRFMGLLAHAGERVRQGQPVAWLRMAL